MYQIKIVLFAGDSTYNQTRYVRYEENDFDGWMTRYERDAKTWKTKNGAQRWIDNRPGMTDHKNREVTILEA